MNLFERAWFWFWFMTGFISGLWDQTEEWAAAAHDFAED